MRKSFALNGFALVIAAASSALAAEDSLFSSVRTDAVYSPSAGDQPAKVKPRSSEPVLELSSKVSNAAQLAKLLREAGFEPEEDDENRMVTTETKLDVWTFPVLVMISEDGRQLTLGLLLTSVEDESTILKDKLLELMEANRRYAPRYFGFSVKHKRTELYHVLENKQISGSKLRDEIGKLAEIAKETEKLWDFEAAAENATSPLTAELDTTSPSLTGIWSASRSKSEAFAIKFNEDKTFQLVYINAGKQTQSKGKFTVSGNNLTLEGEKGFRLAGKISSSNDKGFEFTPEKSTTSLKFKRSK